MRLGTLELRRSFATAPTGEPNTPSANAYGGDDAWAYGNTFGMKLGENPEMQGRARFMVYDEMRWGDPQVKSSLWVYKLPMRAATYTLNPAADDPTDRVVRDAVAWQFGLGGEIGRTNLSWSEQLAQAYLELEYGSMFEEIMWGEVEPWRDKDGDVHLLRPIWRFAPRFPATIHVPDGIDTDARTGMISWLRQDIPGTRPIPGEKLVWYTLDREGNDWFGTSILRPMLASWRSKRALLVSAGMAWERYGVGVPAIWYPRGGGDTRKREAEAIGRNWRNHPRSYFTFEGRRGGDGSGWDVEVMDATINDATPLLHYYDEQISTAAMQHFMVLGRTATGNRALGQALGEPFYLAAQTLADEVALQKVRLAFRRFVDVNFGRDVDVPRLIVTNVQKYDVLTIAQAIATLSDAGLSFTDRGTQNDLRDRLQLDQLPEDAAIAVSTLPDNVGIEGGGSGPELPGGGGQRALPSGRGEGVGLGL